jgi:TfoX/Sxy family transcriptional regulator of competence genes
MAYDEVLAQRVREQLAAEAPVTEKAMFGGLAFLLDGNMAVGLSGSELMVRVGPEAPTTHSPGRTRDRST